jgi:hypothetical protein
LFFGDFGDADGGFVLFVVVTGLSVVMSLSMLVLTLVILLVMTIAASKGFDFPAPTDEGVSFMAHGGDVHLLTDLRWTQTCTEVVSSCKI